MNVDIVNLEIALNWLKSFIEDCLYSRLRKPSEIEIKSLSFYSSESWLTEFIEKYNPSLEEFVVLLLAIVPHLQPHFFNKLISEFLPEGGDFPEFGGVKGTNHRGILPTGETAQFILAGDDLEKRLEIQKIFNDDHWFAKQKILRLDPVPEGEPIMSGRLVLDPEIVEWLTLGTISKPRFSIDFPAEYIETEMAWDDLVLPPSTFKQIREIEHWIEYNDTLLQDWGMKKKIKPGYRALFYGPPGTGKTLTATLLGKQTGKDVFRIDLSRVVSKYIGETEKNLSRLFDKAENKDWILFFDEADALFGKRTDIRDAHDKYANQEVAYLLQRIENYNGLVILASNQRANIDEAFVRRFQAIIHFPMPGADERYEIWRKTIPEQLEVHLDIDWRQVANRYELSGASILNVTHYCAVEIMAAQSVKLDLKRLETAIQREFIKEGKVV
ncbi:ATP-binding protein [Methylotuvimicrobium alcaliphilum]|uniref:AAA ATPase central domain protein n=1 Tax=Methylotuvimicrobium alcaliphilum (strain DSM 19304 / NCIMB 14124 / VKM B-2133 / 20Z) TaxID=1091494 RepID=G4ST98_META2|nr:ATP-binding protein [Methylotuvimicrobium alcaliphilum]CCE23851.1 AAA ATPase central domain protein [Methylotuvimicrobium alcaliphilum 20Z]